MQVLIIDLHFSYITSTGVGQPSLRDPGMKSFEPEDWRKAYDTSKAVRAETEMYKEAGETAGRVGSMIIGAVAPAGSQIKANVAGTGSIFGAKTSREEEEEKSSLCKINPDSYFCKD